MQMAKYTRLVDGPCSFVMGRLEIAEVSRMTRMQACGQAGGGRHEPVLWKVEAMSFLTGA